MKTGTVLRFLLAVLSMSGACSFAQDITLNIGILSPLSGHTSEYGKAHEFWIEDVFSRYARLEVNGYSIVLNPVSFNTRSMGDDRFCRDKAEELLEVHGVVVILGPVRSDCVKSVLSAGLAVPVISSLASATSLTNGNAGWFFRANGNDRRRVRKLWNHITTINHAPMEQQWIIVHDESRYGKGLRDDLEKEMVNIEPRIIEVSRDSAREDVFAALSQVLDAPDKMQNIFLLGDTKSVVNSLMATNLITGDELRNVRIFTVGSPSQLLKAGRLGVTAVGELQMRESEGVRLGNELESALARSRNENIPFVPTTYQLARHIVPAAVARALEKVGAENLSALRSAVREELATGQFDSLQPPDKVSFQGGEMNDIFEFPIYQILPTFNRVDESRDAHGWVEFTTGHGNVNFLETPIQVSYIPHNLQGTLSTFTLSKKSGEDVAQQEVLFGEAKQQQLQFHTLLPGDYVVTTGATSYPAQVSFKVGFSPFYLCAIFVAVISVIIKHKFASIAWPQRIEVILEGTIIGVAIAFMSTYVQYSVVPVATSDWNLLNASMYGFLGGWFGPTIVKSLAQIAIPSEG